MTAHETVLDHHRAWTGGDGDHVTLLHHPHTAVTRTAAVAEYLTVRDGVIVESLLVFDRLSFAPPDAP